MALINSAALGAKKEETKLARLKTYTYKDERGNEITQKLSEEDAKRMGLVKETQTKKKTTASSGTTARNKARK